MVIPHYWWHIWMDEASITLSGLLSWPFLLTLYTPIGNMCLNLCMSTVGLQPIPTKLFLHAPLGTSHESSESALEVLESLQILWAYNKNEGCPFSSAVPLDLIQAWCAVTTTSMEYIPRRIPLLRYTCQQVSSKDKDMRLCHALGMQALPTYCHSPAHPNVAFQKQLDFHEFFLWKHLASHPKCFAFHPSVRATL